MLLDREAARIAEDLRKIPGDLLLSRDQAAKIMGCSIRFLEDAAAAGSGPRATAMGRAIRYRTENLITWLEQRVAARRARGTASGKAGRDLMEKTKRQIVRRRLG